MKTICTTSLAAIVLWLTASMAYAATTSIGANISRGSSDSMAYSINIGQKYEPWFESSLFSFTPFAELGGHAWVPDDSDSDTVWGAFLAPGLRLTLFTDSPIQPYMEGSIGGTINSKKKMDERKLGSHALFRSRGSVGVSFGDNYRHRIQGDYIHYSTWGLTNDNAGYNTYGVSYGFSF